MNNQETIATLDAALVEIDARIAELTIARYAITGDPLIVQRKRDKMIRALSRMEHERGRLRRELITRQTRASAGKDVPELSSERRDELSRALTAVRRKIAEQAQFDAVLELARIITDATARAIDAVD